VDAERWGCEYANIYSAAGQSISSGIKNRATGASPRCGKYLAGSLSCGLSSTAAGVIAAIGGSIVGQLLAAEEQRLVCGAAERTSDGGGGGRR
jgi:hypothetical protein